MNSLRKGKRAEQLRRAKRAQRLRERKAGLVFATLKLPAALAERLSFAAKQEGFQAALRSFLNEETIRIADYPELALLSWNRQSPFVTPREAWALYERNWRFVDRKGMAAHERDLLRSLAARFGAGVIHV